MAITATPYGKFLLGLGSAQFDFGANTFKIALTTSSYTPNVDTHEFFTDLTNEVTGTGYTAGGATLASVTWTYDSTNHRGVMSAATVTWSAATFTTRYAVIYKSTGTGSTSRLVGWIDFGTNQSAAAEDFPVSFTNGVVRIKAG